MLRYIRSLIMVIAVVFIGCDIICAQSNLNKKTLHASYTHIPIELDGYLTERIWQEAFSAKDFYMNFPADQSYAQAKTEVKMTYDDQFIYISAVCYDSLPGDPVITSLKRDYNIYENDAFIVLIDPFEDYTNGFLFALTPYGVQAEGLISFGEELLMEWDNKWYSEVVREKYHWSLEIAIPLKTLRYPQESKMWNVNFARNYRKLNERSTWVPIPRNFNIHSLAFTGTILFSENLMKPGKNLSLIPYASGNHSGITTDGQSSSNEVDAGLDAKWAITPSLNLDLTVNPDFSQAEVDQQVINLQRFELFFPERRQFFLENSDLFGGFGVDNNRPFFSRRIGLVKDVENARNIESRILLGARLSGKIDKNWRLGLMNIQTEKNKEIDAPANNYSVVALQRKVFSRSNISALIINKQNTSSSIGYNTFNRIAGLEYNLASKHNTWNGKSYYHHSMNPSSNWDNYTHGVNVTYNRKKIIINSNYEYVGENYNTEVGFLQRNGYWRTKPQLEYRFFRDRKIIYHGPILSGSWLIDTDGLLLDRISRFTYNIVFLNNSSLKFLLTNYFIKLFAPFDPTNSNGVPLEQGLELNYNRYSAQYFSDPRKVLSYVILLFDGSFFNGKRLSFNSVIRYRIQPYINLSITFKYDKLTFPQPQSDADFFLISPNLNISFTDKLFLNTFVQYNEQIDNINLNTRLQWRFKPVSDLFIVYTENYIPKSFHTKNRSVVIKLTYWFNL